MGKSSIPARTQGLAILDPRFTIDALVPIGPNPDDSSYTEAGPRAGVPVAGQRTDMVLEAAGDQTKKIEILTQNAGHPLRDGGEFIWRFPDDHGDDEWLGHDGFMAITGWEGMTADGTGGQPLPSPIVRLEHDRALLMVEWSGSSQFKTHKYDPDSGAWTVQGTTTLTPAMSAGAANAPHTAMISLPNGRVQLYITDSVNDQKQIHVMYTEDDGLTWAEASRGGLLTPSTDEIQGIAVSHSRGTVAMMLWTNAGAAAVPGSAQQYVSHDLGLTFTTVGDDWFTATSPQERPYHITMVGLDSGKHVMAYWASEAVAGQQKYHVRVFTPGSPAYLETDTTIAVPASGCPLFADFPSCAMWADESGGLFFIAEIDEDGDSRTDLWYSIDGGVSWFPFKTSVFRGRPSGADTRPSDYRVASIGGRAAWTMRWESAHAYSGASAAIAYLGGHTSASMPSVDDGTGDFSDPSWMGFGDELGGTARWGGSFIPINNPNSMGFAVAGAGAGAVDADLLYAVTTTAGQRKFYSISDTASQPSNKAMFAGIQAQCDSGGVLTALEVGFRLRLSDYDTGGVVNATHIHEIEVRMTATQFRVWDVIANVQVGGDQSFDLTEQTWFLVGIKGDGSGSDQGELTIWYGRPDGQIRLLEVGVQTGTLNDDSGANPTNTSRVEFGHDVAGGAATSRWGFMGWGCSAGPTTQRVPSNWLGAWTNPEDLRGRHFPGDFGYLVDDTSIRAVDGPTREGDRWTITPNPDYGVRNMHPTLHESPRLPHRTTEDQVATRYVWDLEKLFTSAYLGNGMLLFGLFGSNVNRATVRGWTGGVPTTIAELEADFGFTGLPHLRKGTTVRPDNSQIAAGGNYLWMQEHADDTFDLGAGETPIHKITHNTGGAWRVDGGAAKVKQPTIYLDPANFKGPEAASGTGDIWSRDFVAITREYAGTFDKISLEIPSHETADGYYQIGTFFWGHIEVFGQQYDLGWIRSKLRNWVRDETDSWLDTFASRSPGRRQVEFAWENTATQLKQEQTNQPDPDYLADGPSGLPVASRNDVVRVMEGILDWNDGPVLPMVYCARIPVRVGGSDAWFKEARRKLFMLCRSETGSRIENLAARSGEGVDEVERLNTVTLEEIV